MQWISTIVHAHITSSWETVIISLYQILICNFVPIYILTKIIVLCAKIQHYSNNSLEVH